MLVMHQNFKIVNFSPLFEFLNVALFKMFANIKRNCLVSFSFFCLRFFNFLTIKNEKNE